ncbi:CaiB/BaiF CoA transferase family protein [Aeromicrobium terrae]|nr:CoA transferase [Aeromicrobium terrae]
MSAPLAGLRIVEFGHYIAAPAATQILSDLGADVVKVEPPAGDQARTIGAYGEGIVAAYNRGKRSVVLDLKDADDRARALDLVDAADAVVQNLRAGVMDRLGLGPDALLGRRPDLVYVSVSGFTPGSPSENRPGLDIAAQAESGMMWVTGEPDGDPQRIGFPVADVGASYAVVQAVLAALLRRERTGEGGVAHVSLVDVAIHMQSAMWGEWAMTGTEPRRKGNGQATAAPAADLVTTADGLIVLSAYTTTHFARLCELIGKSWMTEDPRFRDNPSRVAHRRELLTEISEVLGTRTTDDCLRWLGEAGLVAAAVRRYSDVASSPDVAAGSILTTGVDWRGRRFQVPSLPFVLDGVDPVEEMVVPHAGANAPDELGT